MTEPSALELSPHRFEQWLLEFQTPEIKTKNAECRQPTTLFSPLMADDLTRRTDEDNHDEKSLVISELELGSFEFTEGNSTLGHDSLHPADESTLLADNCRDAIEPTMSTPRIKSTRLRYSERSGTFQRTVCDSFDTDCGQRNLPDLDNSSTDLLDTPPAPVLKTTKLIFNDHQGRLSSATPIRSLEKENPILGSVAKTPRRHPAIPASNWTTPFKPADLMHMATPISKPLRFDHSFEFDSSDSASSPPPPALTTTKLFSAPHTSKAL